MRTLKCLLSADCDLNISGRPSVDPAHLAHLHLHGVEEPMVELILVSNSESCRCVFQAKGIMGCDMSTVSKPNRIICNPTLI